MPIPPPLLHPSAAQAAHRGLSAWARLLAARALLALALVVAQGGAFTHLIGHVADAPHAQSAGYVDTLGDDHSPADAFGLCLQCLALGGLDLPLGEQGGRVFAAASHHAQPGWLPSAAPAERAPPPRCRAPPVIA